MLLLAALAIEPLSADAATLTVQTNQLGSTPNLLGYNAGHFYPGSNTREWWRYAGVTGARVFISPSNIEPSDDVAPVGDGVTSQATFLARRAAIRTNQFNAAYINWSVFNNNYAEQRPGREQSHQGQLRPGRAAQAGHRICVADHRQPIAFADRGHQRLGEHVGAVAALLRAGLLPRSLFRCGALPDVQRAQPPKCQRFDHYQPPVAAPTRIRCGATGPGRRERALRQIAVTGDPRPGVRRQRG